MRFSPAAALFVALAFAGSASTALAQTIVKADDGTFAVAAMITTDPTWRERFTENAWPRVDKAIFAVGESGTLALVFANAEIRNGEASIVCDVTLYDDRVEKVIAEKTPCYQGPAGVPGMANPVMVDWTFTVLAGDALGKAGFRVTITDAHSGRAIPVDVSYAREPAP